MNDSDCVGFLQWALPRLGMRWAGFRRVRGQVCKRLRRRMAELSCPDAAQYREYLQAQPDEWPLLDALCRVTVTRFYRDRQVFAVLVGELLPGLARAALARDAGRLRIWSAGCASGEEPYTLAIAWHLALAGRFPGLRLEILATDADAGLLARGAQGCYAASAVRNLPPEWLETAFEARADAFCLRAELKAGVRFLQHDVRQPFSQGEFDLVCCRNLAFTYFDHPRQVQVAEQIRRCLRPEGVLMLGVREELPPEARPGYQVISRRLALFRRLQHTPARPADP